MSAPVGRATKPFVSADRYFLYAAPMRFLFSSLLALSLGCAHVKDDKTVCTEYRAMRCVAGAVCAMDKARGCQVCHCESVAPQGRDGNPTLAAPPGTAR